ncbi:hypothetical protein [Microcoleus sp. PH2017_30_WIL_O_A]|uniref:hypothetical protein n=1 Tax=Microcoleus sp. PH2017_30_WIL_O_A TaxID=2798840 RepID=UPI001DAC71B7|nr:hypothetical protein [Microcoleus sp. PH2017_30_WIL_O_A]MCC3588002.1 hypothetical protein [Microcoleus sp. PH2017_30_WIL_O_A]
MNAFLEFMLLGYESYPKVRNLKLLAQGCQIVGAIVVRDDVADGFHQPEPINLPTAIQNQRR